MTIATLHVQLCKINDHVNLIAEGAKKFLTGYPADGRERPEKEAKMTIETKDLWQSAYLLAEGGWLSKVKVQRRNDGKREVVFQFTGETVEDLARRFISGQAVCNVTKLKAQVNHLKDVIFGGACPGE